MVILPSTIIQNGNYLFIEHFLRKWGKRQLFPWYVYKIQPRVVSECRSMMKLCSSTYNWPIRYRDIHQAAWWFFLAVSIWNLWRCRYENKLINAGWWFQTWLLFSIIYIYVLIHVIILPIDFHIFQDGSKQEPGSEYHDEYWWTDPEQSGDVILGTWNPATNPDCFSKCLKQRNVCNFINVKPFFEGFCENDMAGGKHIGSSLNQNWNHEESTTLSFIYKGPLHLWTLRGAHTHTLDKKWIIEVIRWELNPLTCS